MTLFQQIAAKQTKLTDRVSDSDKVELEQAFAKIEKARKEYRKFEAYLKVLPEFPESDHFDFSKEITKLDQDIVNQLEALVEKAVKGLVSYFNKGYGLSIYLKDEALIQASKSIDFFLKTYFQVGDITDLKKGGEDKLINDFHKQVSNPWSVKAILQGKSVRLKDYYCIDEFTYQMDKSWRVSYSYRSNVRLMKDAILFFETSSINSDGALKRKLIPDEKISEPVVDLSLFDKLEKIQYYKNGSIKITFNSKQHAQDFFKLYRFDQLRAKNNNY